MNPYDKISEVDNTAVVFYFIPFQFEVVWTSPTPLFTASPAMRKNSPFTKFFKHFINTKHEFGLFSVLNQRKNQYSEQKCFETSNHGHPLGLTKLVSLFIIMIVGMALSFSIFLFEFLHKPKKTSTKHFNGEKNLVQLRDTIRKILPLLNGTLREDTKNFLQKLQQSQDNTPP